MKTTGTFIAIGLVCGVLIISGCQDKQTASSNAIDQRRVNQAMLETYSDIAIQNAIITQHTLYPYHFVNNSADLNGIGKRDLAVLIQHFLQNPGQINLQKGTVDEVLYRARKQTVYDNLLKAGIPQEKIRIADGMPGGNGMPSNSVIEILEKAKEAPAGDQQSGTQIQFYPTTGK